MQIRQAAKTDIPGILNVLKASLGETSSKKTAEIWRYKHIENPFGESLVLVAEESGVIIGVRAFMRWQWKRGEKVYSAFRAVDTATHPAHQGKGIFKKLTLAALQIGKENKDHFVFNTPNSQSKPGYLKMGWQEVGKLHTYLVPMSPIFWNSNQIFDYPIRMLSDNAKLLELWNKKLVNSNLVFTPKDLSYLEWRYINNPIQSYRVEAKEGFFIAAYVKNHKYFKELRVSELIFFDSQFKNDCADLIKKWSKEYGVSIISVNLNIHTNLFALGVKGNFGPFMTFKYLQKLEIDFLNINNWSYSLGDLELF